MTRDTNIQHAIFDWQSRLRLGSWDIRYDPKWEDNPEESANCNYRMNEQVATIRIDPEVEGDNLGAHIVHELAHIVMADYRHLVYNAIAGLGGPTSEILLNTLSDMEERICDTIAHALTGVTYIPVGSSKEVHAPFLDTTVCTD
jgi:hypothetical protein